MDITLNGVTFRNGIPYNRKLNLTQRSDGTWHATNFGDTLQSTASKSGASQSRNCDTYESETPTRTKLSDQEIAELADKYDPHNMTQDQYDTFLDDLMEKGALSRFDAMRLGYKGFRILDIDIATFATGGIGCGSAHVTSGGSVDRLKQTLEDTEGDLMIWLESMMAQQDQGTDTATKEGSRQKAEALKTLHDIVKRM